MLTDRVTQYLKLLAEEHIDGDDERDYQEERDLIWPEMTMEEKDTTNNLVDRIFGDWL